MTLTAEKARELFSYNPESGELQWKTDVRSGRNGNAYSARAGHLAGRVMRDGYRRVLVARQSYAVHRIIWLIVVGDWPQHTIDHIDGKRDNNRWSNLRDITQTANIQNQRRAQSDNRSTGLLGVNLEKAAGKVRKYRARITVGGCSRTIGMFATPEEAHAAYLDAKRRFHPGCTI